MKITEVIFEASRGEKLAAKRAAADAKREAERAAREAENARIAAKIKSRQQKKIAAFNAPISTQSNIPKEPEVGPFDNPELDKYRVDDTVDTTFEGGFYLKFNVTPEDVDAYWSKGDISFEQAKLFKQFVTLGLEFDQTKFEHLVQYLIQKSSPGGSQPGYVHISLNKRYLKHPFFYDLYNYLLRNYPQDDPTLDASVGWEVE